MEEVMENLCTPSTSCTSTPSISWSCVRVSFVVLLCRARAHLSFFATFTQYNERYDTVVSADEGGFIEYWQPTEPWELPTGVSGLWEFKSATDLYEFKKVRPIVPFLFLLPPSRPPTLIHVSSSSTRPNPSPPPSPSLPTPPISRLSPSPTVKSEFSPSSPERRPASTTSPFRLSRRCSRLERPCSGWTIWSSGGVSLSRGSWRKSEEGSGRPLGTKRVDFCCILRCWVSRVSLYLSSFALREREWVDRGRGEADSRRFVSSRQHCFESSCSSAG